MKILGALTLLLISSTGFCQETTIDIIPKLAADCVRFNYPLLNQIGDVKKLSEDGDSVTFSFDTVYGACQNGIVSPLDMNAQAEVIVMRDKLVLFQKDPVQSSIILLSATNARVTMTFDKNKIFHSRDVSTFSMDFLPNGQPAPRVITYGNGTTYTYFNSYTYFPWEIVLTQVDDTTSSMSVQIGQATDSSKK